MNREKPMETNDFLALLYKYVCASGSYKRIKNEIGFRKAMILKAFLCEYLECSDVSLEDFTREFLENAPLFGELLR